MVFLTSLLALLPLAGTVYSQSVSYVDSGITWQGLYFPDDDVRYGFVFPPTPSGEFLGEIVFPVGGWAGISLGGQMQDDLLVVGWNNGNSMVSSTRYATDYLQPLPYAGPIVTTLGCTTVNSTYFKWIYRCQNCTTWQGGSMATSGNPVLAYAISTAPVFTPSDPNSNFNEHTDFNFWGQSIDNSISSNYNSYISSCGGGGSTVTTTSKVTTTTHSTTSTTSTHSTTPTTTSHTTTPTTTSHTTTTTTYSTTSTSVKSSTTTHSTTSTKPTTTSTTSKPITTSHTTTSTAPTATQTLYGQCGGIGWTGPTICATGSKCVSNGAYYSQCVPA